MNHTIANQTLSVTISERGAALMSIRGETEYLWQGDPAFWEDRAPNIFPYVGRLNDERYTVDGREYRLPIHGFAQHSIFSMIKNTGSSIVLELTETKQTLTQYPYQFSFHVEYRLLDNCLHIMFHVHNRSRQRMYFGLGGHPGFNVPMEAGKTFEDYQLRFDPPCEPLRVRFTPDGFCNGKETPFPLRNGCLLPLSHELFDEDAVVLRSASHSVTLAAEGGRRGVRIISPQMRYIGFWHTPEAARPFCLHRAVVLPPRNERDCHGPCAAGGPALVETRRGI